MPTKADREYRNMDFQIKEGENEPSFLVEGYAATFEPYVLLTIDGVDYSERIEPTAFDETDMSDVVFRVDHEGPVYARSSAGTVKVNKDGHGLFQQTDLSRTQRARELYADIEAGNYPKMSFAFTVAEDHFDSATNTRVIDRVGKIYDVSPVSFPANPDTELHARSFFDGEIEKMKAAEAERLQAEEERRRDLERREGLKNMIQEVITK